MSRKLRRVPALAIPALTLALLPFTGMSVAAPAGQPTSVSPRAAAAPVGGSLWTRTASKPQASHKGHRRTVNPSSYKAYTLDKVSMAGRLDRAPLERSKAARRGKTVKVVVPAPTGELVTFAVVESPVMQRKLQRKHPNITTYAGSSVTKGYQATVRLDQTPLGFHASVIGADKKSWYIDPAYVGDTSLYLSYWGDALPAPEKAFTEPRLSKKTTRAIAKGGSQSVGEGPNGIVKRREYRLALVSDPSYATYFGVSNANVLSAKTTLMNRINQVYNDDLAVKMLLVNGTDKLNFDTLTEATGTNGPCGGAACYSAADMGGCGNVIDKNTHVLAKLIGAENYDIGHIVFGASGDGGGVAYLGAVGMDTIKGGGCTGLANPVGDGFAVDYVAHEMGHEFAGNHTFNGSNGSCGGGNGNAATSVEPGSGTSVMAYAGICAQDDLQPHSDPYFSQRSQTEITAHITGALTSFNEVQEFGLSGFTTAGESFVLDFNGTQTAAITSGTNYTAAGIKAAIQAAIGGTETASSVSANGFTVTYAGTLAATNVVNPTIVPVSGSFTSVGGDYVKGGPNTRRGTEITTTNHNPTVTAPALGNKTIPYHTPFTLTGSGTDSDGDTLIYLWEQNNPGTGAGTLGVHATGPLFRVFGQYANVTAANTLLYSSPGENLASTSPSRTFPDIAQIAANETDAESACAAISETSSLANNAKLRCHSEYLPDATYNTLNGGPMLFRLTARDQAAIGGGTHYADVAITVSPTIGPFLVTSPNTAVSYAGGSTQTVTWSNTTSSLSTNVKISLSTDGGLTYPTVIAASTPNDGSQAVTIPNTATTTARIKVEAVENYFFDISNTNFTITTLVNQTAPSISGTPAVGSLLTANPGTWSQSGVTFAYQWTANGVPIAGATSQTFTPTAAEDGKFVAVQVTGSKAGYVSATASSPSVRIATTPISNTVPPLITGSPSVGATLSLSTGTWNYGDLTYTYQWYANGAAIRAANQSTYVVSVTMSGRTITGRVTATRPGSDAVVATSSNSVTPS